MRDLGQGRGRRVVWLAVMLLPLVAGAAHRTELRAESRVQENGGPGRNLGDDPGRPATEPGAGAFHALLIAVDDYRHAQVEDLDHPVSDAARLRAVLTEDYGFRPENVRVLENASEDEILTSLWRLHQTVTGADSVLLFFAGHGIWKPDIEQGYWLPADATRASPARWISNSDIRDSIRGLGARHTLLISDACFSGSLFKTRKAFSEAGQAIQELYRLPSRKAMTSGTLSEVPDRSVFMEYLTKKLRENREPWVSADELFFGFRQAVINNGSATPQYGVIHGTGDEGGEFIFVRSGEAPPVPSVPPVRWSDQV